MVVVDVVRVVEQAADEGGFAVVDTTGGGEAEQILAELGFEALLDGQFESVREWLDCFENVVFECSHQK